METSAAATPQIIAVVGASGSGKSTLVERLLTDNAARVSVLRVDDYYRDLSHLTLEERDCVNFDHPDAIEFERLCEDLRALKRGEVVATPIYDFTIHNRAAEIRQISPTPIVIVEGILALSDPVLAALVNQVIFIETPLETCLARRIERDGRNRGRSEASVRDFWYTRAEPMFFEYVAPCKQQAHLVLSGENDLSESYEQLASWLLE